MAAPSLEVSNYDADLIADYLRVRGVSRVLNETDTTGETAVFRADTKRDLPAKGNRRRALFSALADRLTEEGHVPA